jgi:hypothetical protein
MNEASAWIRGCKHGIEDGRQIQAVQRRGKRRGYNRAWLGKTVFVLGEGPWDAISTGCIEAWYDSSNIPSLDAVNLQILPPRALDAEQCPQDALLDDGKGQPLEKDGVEQADGDEERNPHHQQKNVGWKIDSSRLRGYREERRNAGT